MSLFVTQNLLDLLKHKQPKLYRSLTVPERHSWAHGTLLNYNQMYHELLGKSDSPNHRSLIRELVTAYLTEEVEAYSNPTDEEAERLEMRQRLAVDVPESPFETRMIDQMLAGRAGRRPSSENPRTPPPPSATALMKSQHGTRSRTQRTVCLSRRLMGLP